MRPILLFIILLLAAPAYAADICTKPPASEPEKILCNDYALKELDKRLNQTYSLLIKSGASNATLRSEQRAWLQLIRNKCKSRDCLEAAYIKRLAALLETYAQAKEITSAALTNKEAMAVCNDIAVLAQNKSLANIVYPGFPGDIGPIPESWQLSIKENVSLTRHFYSHRPPIELFKLKTGSSSQLEKFVSIFTGGTCYSAEIYNLEKTSDLGIDPVDDPEDEIRWSTWGAGEFPIHHRQRNFVVAGSADRPTQVSWIKPNGRLRPLCLMESVSSRQYVINSKIAPLCQGIANGSLAATRWQDVSNNIPIVKSEHYLEDSIKMFGFYVQDIAIQSLDVDGDRKPEIVARFSEESGAGCGAHQEWLRELKPGKDGIRESAANRLLENLGPSTSIRLFLYHDKWYASIHDIDETTNVYALGHPEPERVCVLGTSVKSRITKLFKLSPASATSRRP